VNNSERNLYPIEQCRRFYADEIRVVAGLDSVALVEAFAMVPRERFLESPPWHLSSGSSLHPATYRTTNEVRDLYHDVFVALKSAEFLNNGQPSMIAQLIAALNLCAGKRVLHIGCGTGYYSAIIAQMVGPQGAVTAVEIDTDLARQATANLTDYPNVTVLNADGAAVDPDLSDAILVNAGVTHPRLEWLANLSESGILVLPLSVGRSPAAKDAIVVRIARNGASFVAEPISILTIYPGAGMRDPAMQKLLNASFESHAILRLESLRTDAHDQTDSCLVHAPTFCLSALPAASK
jgi:protein-L-isoaspartate(D-aspartate) O-methyltransferase